MRLREWGKVCNLRIGGLSLLGRCLKSSFGSRRVRCSMFGEGNEVDREGDRKEKTLLEVRIET